MQATAVVGDRASGVRFSLTVDMPPPLTLSFGTSALPALVNAGEIRITVNRGANGPADARVVYTVFKGQEDAVEEVPLPAEERIWVSPEFGAMTRSDGVAIAVVPREAGIQTSGHGGRNSLCLTGPPKTTR